MSRRTTDTSKHLSSASFASLLGEEDCLLVGVVDVAVQELFVEGALNCVDKCFLSAMRAKGCAQRLEEEGRRIHLAGQV